ncbi:Protein kinase [Mycena kentingensis (nom. inval.)]|nr:Protein kinase [Mycena kentingensis (nom. inval.)]
MDIRGAEHLARYRPGGFHPTHLGDTFSDGRYTVINKLGDGTRSTVWLVHDAKTSSYVALKIVASERESSGELAVLKHLAETYDGEEEGSRHVARMLDHFMHEGPNGKHLCIVSDVQGPHIVADKLYCFFNEGDDEVMSPDIARRVCGQIALGVAYLHKRGIAHGDLHATNILFSFPRPWMSLEEIERDLGAPHKLYYTPTPEEKASPHLPKYIVPATALRLKADLLRICLQKPNVRICDFGEAYIPNIPRPSPLATPRMYRPAQAILRDAPHATLELDIWALAVLFHVLFAGFGLFFEDDDDLLANMAFSLGPFPEPYWSEWENRPKYFDDAGNALGWRTTFVKLERVRSMPRGSKEREAFEALLRRMTRYEPGERISAQSVVEDDWVREFCRSYMGRDVEFDIEYLPSDLSDD